MMTENSTLIVARFCSEKHGKSLALWYGLRGKCRVKISLHKRKNKKCFDIFSEKKYIISSIVFCALSTVQ